MTMRKTVMWLCCVLASALLVIPVFSQDRGTAELKAGTGKITIDYGRPQLKGRDPATWQKDGSYWRMGSNATTTITTPVDLVFGATKVPKGKYSLWLLKVSADKYMLVFNSSIPDMGMLHDNSTDVASVALQKEAASSSVEALTMDLTAAPGGGIFSLSWGMLKVTAKFDFGK